MKIKKRFIILMTFLSLLTVGCNDNTPLVTSTPSNGEVIEKVYQNIDPTYSKEGKIYELNEDGSLKSETILPILNDENYSYVESNGVAIFTHSSGYVTKRVIGKETLKIGGEIFNNVNCHFAGIEGLSISYDIDRYYLSSIKDIEITIGNIEGENLQIRGEGILNTGKIKSNLFVVESGVTLNVNCEDDYGLNVKSASLENGSNVNVTVKNHNAIAVDGIFQAYGNMYVKKTGDINTKAGVEFIGTNRLFRVTHSSRVTIDGFEYGVYVESPNAGKITRPGSLGWTECTENGPTAVYPGQGDAKLPYDGQDKDGNYNFLLKTINCTYRWNCADTNP